MVVPPSPPYQDLLRAVGRLLDREGWRDVALAEEPEGLSVRGTRPAGVERAAAELRLTLEDLARLRREAHEQRGWVPPGDAAGYQARLRAVGWLGEVAGLRGLRVAEAGDDLLVQGWPAGAAEMGGRRLVDRRLTPADIAVLLDQLRRLRGNDTRQLRPRW